jgi:hypothetical protein
LLGKSGKGAKFGTPKSSKASETYSQMVESQDVLLVAEDALDEDWSFATLGDQNSMSISF